MRRVLGGLAAALLWAPPGPAGTDPAPGTAPRVEFEPLVPGSYRLPVIQRVSDARLLDMDGREVSLRALTRGKITLLTFFYTYCVEPLGCQFAHQTLVQLRERIVRDPALAHSVRFLGLSCDPGNDTPATLAYLQPDVIFNDIRTLYLKP